MTSRRTVLKATGVTLGTAALGSAAYATTQDSSQAPEIEWQKTYDNTVDDFGKEVLETVDGYAVLVNVGSGSPEVLEYARDGTHQKTLGDDIDGPTDMTAFVRTPEGGYVLAGQRPGDPDHAEAIRLASDGTIVWQRAFESEGGSLFADVTRRPEGGYALVGDKGVAWLVTMTEGGSIEADRTYPEDASKESTFAGIAQGHAGGYAIAGSEEAGSPGWLLKVDESLEEEWDRTGEPSLYDDVIRTQDGGYAVNGNNVDQFFLRKVGGSGDAFEKAYSESGNGTAYGLTQTDAGEFVLVGNGNGDSGPVRLVGTDDTGDQQWTTELDEDTVSPNEPDPIAATEDGGFITVATLDRSHEREEIYNVVVTKFGPPPESETGTETEPETEDDDSDTPTPTSPPTTATEPGTETQTDEEDCEI